MITYGHGVGPEQVRYRRQRTEDVIGIHHGEECLLRAVGSRWKADSITKEPVRRKRDRRHRRLADGMDVATGKGVARRVPLHQRLLSFVWVSPDVAIVKPGSLKRKITAERP